MLRDRAKSNDGRGGNELAPLLESNSYRHKSSNYKPMKDRKASQV